MAWLYKLVNGISNRYTQTIQTCTDSLPLKKSTYYHKHKWQHEHVVIFPGCIYFNIMLVSMTWREDQRFLRHLYWSRKNYEHICNDPFFWHWEWYRTAELIVRWWITLFPFCSTCCVMTTKTIRFTSCTRANETVVGNVFPLLLHAWCLLCYVNKNKAVMLTFSAFIKT